MNGYWFLFWFVDDLEVIVVDVVYVWIDYGDGGCGCDYCFDCIVIFVQDLCICLCGQVMGSGDYFVQIGFVV